MKDLTSEETSLFVYIMQKVLRLYEHKMDENDSLLKHLELIDELTQVNNPHNRQLMIEIIAKI